MTLRSAAERQAAGRALRSAAPRSSHGGWQPPDGRPDPLLTLRDSEAVRLPELLGLRYARMAASPFGFLRGSAGVMATDLATTPRSGLRVQACGDAHIGNFRLLGTPERKLNFDLNDFDETLPAPFEWDLKRLAASAVVAARHNGVSREGCRRIAERAARSYRLRIDEFAHHRLLDAWYTQIGQDDVHEMLQQGRIGAQQRKMLQQRVRKALEKDNIAAMVKLTTKVDGAFRFREDPPLLYHHGQDDEVIKHALKLYRDTLPYHVRLLFDRYELVDYAVKVVGVGSVGTRCWAALFVGGDDKDPLILQVKQASRSVLEPFTGRSRQSHQGRRVVDGQRTIQAAGDIFLGWTRGISGGADDHVDYYVRQLWDMKGKVDPLLMNEGSMALFVELSGWVLARAHARSGDAAAIHGYIGGGPAFDQAIGSFALEYADQTERDHERLAAAVEKGDLPGADLDLSVAPS